MQDRQKLIIIGGAGVFIIVVSIIFMLVKINSLEQIKRDNEAQIATLNANIDELNKEKQALKENLDKVSQELADLAQERSELQAKFDSLVQENDKIKEELTRMKEEKEKILPGGSSGNIESAMARRSADGAANDAYWGVILKRKADLEVQVEALKEKLKQTQLDMDALRTEKSSLSLEYNNLHRDSAELQRVTEYNQKMSDHLTKELASEKTDKLELSRRFMALKNENKSLRHQLNTLGNHRLQLERKVFDLQSKNSALEKTLNNMEVYMKQQMVTIDSLQDQISSSRSRKSLLESKYDATRLTNRAMSESGSSRSGSIELPPIVVKPQGQGQYYSGSYGSGGMKDGAKVISVDRDNNFVILNLGRIDGVKIGDTLQVYRFDQPIGIVEVLQVRDRLSACDIKRETSPIAEGDLVQ